MATEFLMPKLGLTMESGTVIAWLVDDGDEVVAGTPVLSIETDKTVTEVEAVGSGRLHTVAAAGDTYPCGAVIGWLLADGEEPPPVASSPAAPDAPAAAATAAESPPPRPGGGPGPHGRVPSSPNARRVAAALGVDLRRVRGTGPGGRIVAADVELAAAAGPGDGATATAGTPATPSPPVRPTVPATVAARNLADLLGVDLADVPIDQRERRVTRDGVAVHVRGLLARPGGHAAAAGVPLSQTPSSVVALRGMRGTIARRMHESLSQMAQLTLFMDADVGAVEAHRRRRGDGAPGYTDYVVAAVARALVAHPIFNSQVVDDGIALLPDVHVGVAVAVDGGVVVPVVRDAARRGLEEIAVESRQLVGAARSGALRLDDLEGGTCSVTSLGMLGVDGFTPVINPPNAAIVGVGRRREELVLGADGDVAAVARVTLSLTWDHRVADGAPAAAFCRTIVDLLARPDDLDTPA